MDLSKLGTVAGLAAGALVTVALRISRKWNAPILIDGRPADRIPGAARSGDYELRQRHQEVVGPRITARAQQMTPGALQTLVAGFGAGATEAPGATYRFEAKLDSQLKTLGRPLRS